MDNGTTIVSMWLGTYFILSVILYIVFIIANWKIFEKAGEAGWKSIIPIYNAYVIFDIVYGAGWKFLLLLIPLVNIYIGIKFCFDFAKAYGKGTGFGFGLLFLSPIFTLILGYGDSEYVGTVE